MKYHLIWPLVIIAWEEAHDDSSFPRYFSWFLQLVVIGLWIDGPSANSPWGWLCPLVLPGWQTAVDSGGASIHGAARASP
jgi:hypothetical protein